MIKKVKKLPYRNYRRWLPVMYATYFGILKKIARRYGYALAVHGSLRRDMDLVAIPWIEKPKDHLKMFAKFRKALGLVRSDKVPYDSIGQKPHGRIAYTIGTGAGGYLDISVMPIRRPDEK